ncbi:MAG: NYN domain-containing protein [Clostridiales Family XIII bacterium]|jgi:uncharacterized LabA/DUF88 family protein|nr:NYN domain-containing protein [Clostridiales Family XIII bacterium]
MQKVMMFIDYENFEIARQNLYKDQFGKGDSSYHAPRINLVKLPHKVATKLSVDYKLIKTFLFVPEPDDFLIKESWRKKKYDFLKGLGNTDFFTVISGRHVARQLTETPPQPYDKTTYFVDEKGTDINMAVQLITKAYHNAYDTAVILSGDTDYLPIYDILNTIGKTVVVVGVKPQNLSKFKSHSDKQLILDLPLLQDCEKTT